MGLLDPRLPDYSLDEWVALPFTERLRLQCQTWTTQGFGSPASVYGLYVFKAGMFVLGWALFTTTTDGIGGLGDIADWWLTWPAFQKAVLWAMLFEGLGFGCGSGPLTGRYVPPFVAFTHFLRPGTTRLPPWPGRNPVALGNRRSVLDAAGYLAVVVLLVRALSAGLVTTDLLLPIVVLIPLLGLRDKTLFLVFRSEHYWLTLLVLVLVGGSDSGEPTNAVAGAKAVQLAIWWGAATSKLNHHFPSVVSVMFSNAPLIPAAIKRRAFVDAKRDLRPSKLSSTLAHGGTVIEYVFPLVLLLSDGGLATNIALAVMLSFHLFIMSAFALGVPTEWNIFFVFSMFTLFGERARTSVLDLRDPVVIIVLLVSLVAVPIIGNLRPDKASFLPSMRYYAGNWDTSQWLFRKGTIERLDEHITKTSKTTRAQLGFFYDELTTTFLLGKVITFRAMHLHGRLYANLVGRAVPAGLDLDDYDLVDGELVAGLVLGWNFGDGHLHNEELLAAIQQQVGFGPGDVRVVMVGAQPMGKPSWPWRIVDVVEGQLESGRADVVDFLALQPWQVEEDDSIVGAGR